ncbi:hypothetical protein VTH82DRAFT_4867 [Thermothelomyces myriococcoides]
MDSSPSSSRAPEPTLPTAAGVKRSAPSLLPAFEPLSSSPGLPRPSKRHAGSNAFLKYPTPAPTSSTGILSSSPPRLGFRPPVRRTQSTVSERAPLTSVPSVELNENGETLLMGRSSSSSHYQLSANRLISRVHVKARYIAATNPLESNKVEVVCTGWNGLKLHCQGQTWELAKGDSFTSETEGAEIMIDVQDARVMVRWPRRDKDQDGLGHLSDSTWDDSPRPRVTRAGSELQNSPLRRTMRLTSPESPTPANVTTSNTSLDSLVPHGTEEDDVPVEIYEDATTPTSDAENDANEENDPIVHSFGPFASSVSSRFASFSATSPRRKAPVSRNPLANVLESSPLPPPSPLKPTDTNASAAAANIPSAPTPESLTGLSTEEVSTIRNHMINQLAFSRLSSTPLSTILNNLPAAERKMVNKEQLRIIIESTPCVGIIRRQGKDAAGKPLESEYYYTPELDSDEQRRLAVTDGLRKPSLRNCRKQHKQYYWKRPKTP